MDRAWSTSDAQIGRESAYWKEAVCDAIFELDVMFSEPECFQASLTQRSVGPLGLSQICINGSQNIKRTKAAIARSRCDQFELVQFLTGRAELQHVGREIELNAGDCVLIDSRQPYQLRTIGASKNVSVHIPADWLGTRLPHPEQGVGVPISSNSPWGAALAAAVFATSAQVFSVPGSKEACADQIAGALFLSLQANPASPSGHRQKVYLRVAEELSRLAPSPDINASLVAARCGISLRYLHALFADHGTTFRSELRRIRIIRACHMLSDVRFHDISVAEIGRRNGFGEAASFSKVFREVYGQPPASFRRAQTDIIPISFLDS